jgi:virulence-associated protein VagC
MHGRLQSHQKRRYLRPFKKGQSRKVGNSLMMRIPKDIAKFAKLKAGKEVRMSPQGDRIIIEN